MQILEWSPNQRLGWTVPRGVLYPPFVHELELLFPTTAPIKWLVTRGYEHRLSVAKNAFECGMAVEVVPIQHGLPCYDIRHPGWAWLEAVVPINHTLLRHGRTSQPTEWTLIEWKSWRDFQWGLRSVETVPIGRMLR